VFKYFRAPLSAFIVFSLQAFTLRGGVKKASLPSDMEDDEDASLDVSPKRQGPVASAFGAFSRLPPITRFYLSLVLLCSVADMVLGSFMETAQVFALDWKRTIFELELWRPLTGSAYLGPLSMHWATNIYFLISYGMALEALNG
jgi:hypothetical protein